MAGKPWESETAPKTPPTTPADPDPDIVVKDNTAADEPGLFPKDMPEKTEPSYQPPGENASLVLVNLVSRGMTMAAAKKQLGIK